MKNVLSASKDINHEYCCTVVRIGLIEPIENSDFLGKTLVNGLTIVIRKDLVKEGDIMIYAANQTALSTEFLSVTNQFDMSHRELNSNYEEVEKKKQELLQLAADGKQEEADKLELEIKQMVGFFNQKGQVKMLKLRGCMSMGYLISLNQFEQYCPEIREVNLDEWVDKDFDTVNDKLFVQVYVPGSTNTHHTGKGRQYGKVKRFDRMIPGQFMFHYDTQQLNRSMDKIQPDTEVTCSVKLHGTSFIFGNIKVKQPRWGGLYTKIFNKLPGFLQFTKIGYDDVYSSRTVVKNKYITDRPVSDDIWTEYYNILKGHINPGMTVYGEIVGYMTDGTKMVQKNYDYGCKAGTNKLMPYRITEETENGIREWEVKEVMDWTLDLIYKNEDIAPRLMPIKILYTGTLSDLYPEIEKDESWQKNVLEAMKADTKTFGMEKNEPLCKCKVPREGIVVRINGDVCKEAFKLKCLKFLKQEADDIDAGTYEDIEVEEKYQ